MIRALALAIAASVALGASAAAQGTSERPMLKSSAIVTGDIVRVGDLVEHAGIIANVAIFRAPDLGFGLGKRHGSIEAVDAKGCGAAGQVAHASLSPIRNCRARSSRMCGSDRVSPSSLCSSLGGLKRTKVSGCRAPPL